MALSIMYIFIGSNYKNCQVPFRNAHVSVARAFSFHFQKNFLDLKLVILFLIENSQNPSFYS